VAGFGFDGGVGGGGDVYLTFSGHRAITLPFFAHGGATSYRNTPAFKN
jgi:hypothetical protein